MIMVKTILQVLKELTGNTSALTIAELLPELIRGSHYGAKIFSPKGKVSTVSALPASGNEIGDTYHVDEDGGEYAWWPTSEYPNGHWEFIGTIGGSGLPDVTDNDAEKTLFVDEEGNWEVDYAPSNWLVCTWTRTVNGNSVSWSCDRTYNQMINNRNILHRQVIFQYESQSVIATFHHESGESDYFAGQLVVKLNGQYSKVALYCISGIGASVTEERIVPADAVSSVNGQTGAVMLDAEDVGAYAKPATGIPKSDLASAVQTSLGKADTALQAAPVASVNGKTGVVELGASDVGALPNDTPIPSAVTEQTVSDWGFTKNTGTYSKPSSGIPKSDLASDVQTSLGKADTALQSVPTAYRTAVAQDAIDATLISKPANPVTGAFLVYNGSAWVAQTLSTWQGGSY